MKKLLAMLMAAVMVFGMAACGGNNTANNTSGNNTTGNTTGDTTGDETTGTAGGTFTIGVIGPTTGGAAIYGNAVANAAQIAEGHQRHAGCPDCCGRDQRSGRGDPV